MPAGIVFAGDARNPFVVVDKPTGIPSAPLFESSVAPNALRLVANEFPGVMRVRGRKTAEHGLVHRIDTETSGLLLFALTQEAYNFFADEQRHGRFCKTYTAFCHRLPDATSRLGGFPPALATADAGRDKFVCRSQFRSWGRGRREVRPVTAESAPAARRKAGTAVYETVVNAFSIEENAPPQQPHSAADGGTVYRLVAETARGFRHQVRCHLAWLGFPVVGDALYHPAYRGSAPDGAGKTVRRQRTLFFASGLSFRHPLTREAQAFALPVPGGD